MGEVRSINLRHMNDGIFTDLTIPVYLRFHHVLLISQHLCILGRRKLDRILLIWRHYLKSRIKFTVSQRLDLLNIRDPVFCKQLDDQIIRWDKFGFAFRHKFLPFATIFEYLFPYILS